jgi:hypothetical protein
MKIRKILIVSFSLLIISLTSYSQDNRTIETKVADLLTRLPANDIQFTDKLMGDMLSLGESGLSLPEPVMIPGQGSLLKALHVFFPGREKRQKKRGGKRFV